MIKYIQDIFNRKIILFLCKIFIIDPCYIENFKYFLNKNIIYYIYIYIYIYILIRIHNLKSEVIFHSLLTSTSIIYIFSTLRPSLTDNNENKT